MSQSKSPYGDHIPRGARVHPYNPSVTRNVMFWHRPSISNYTPRKGRVAVGVASLLAVSTLVFAAHKLNARRVSFNPANKTHSSEWKAATEAMKARTEANPIRRHKIGGTPRIVDPELEEE